MSASYDCSLESEVRKTNRLPRSFSNLQPVGKQRESQVEEKKASARRRTSEQNLITTCSRMVQAVVQNPWPALRRWGADVWTRLTEQRLLILRFLGLSGKRCCAISHESVQLTS